MFKSVSYKSKQFLALVVKLFIVIGCGYYIYDKIFTNQQQSISNFLSILTKNDVFSLKNALFLLIFTFFNWFLEISKWKILANQAQKTSFSEAAIQSLASLTTSLITPNRIGEYGAKALYFKKALRKKIVALNIVGNVSQLIITIAFGIIGCLYLFFNFKIQFDFTNVIFVVIFLILLCIIFWFIDKNNVTIKGYSIQYFKLKATNFSKKTLQKVMLLSVLRYLIFSHQFYFLALIFNVDILYLDAMMCIFSMYVIASIIPMLSLFDVVLKGSVALFIFSLFQVNETSILAIVLLMWIFNFVLPSIVGSYFVLTFNTNKLIQKKE
ncbi:lysylphosphatidylglycerol synthase domain-containing protein [Polaribacter uvawellassae]|uniref:lysylphosphatidylglycerol synthase domain-containing protein n=1 Tax=Polaribacter uvawellassae TaxID=3133495 RepID=UPI00321ACDCF